MAVQKQLRGKCKDLPNLKEDLVKSAMNEEKYDTEVRFSGDTTFCAISDFCLLGGRRQEAQTTSATAEHGGCEPGWSCRVGLRRGPEHCSCRVRRVLRFVRCVIIPVLVSVLLWFARSKVKMDQVKIMHEIEDTWMHAVPPKLSKKRQKERDKERDRESKINEAVDEEKQADEESKANQKPKRWTAADSRELLQANVNSARGLAEAQNRMAESIAGMGGPPALVLDSSVTWAAMQTAAGLEDVHVELLKGRAPKPVLLRGVSKTKLREMLEGDDPEQLYSNTLISVLQDRFKVTLAE